MADPAAFVEHRGLLFGIAYRILGSVVEAEDVVQDAFVKWQRVPEDRARSPRAYLSSTVTRLAIDHLRSARVQRESYVGPWLPEPLLTSDDDIGAQMELSDSLSTAFLVVLERLSPSERAAFVLREVFDYPYEDVAAILEKSEAACRQLVHRAKQAVAAERPRFPASAQQQQRLTDRFVEACAGGDVNALLAVLTEDAVLVSDGGGNARAAKKPIAGRDRVARFLLGITAQAPAGFTVDVVSINGGAGVLLRVDGNPYVVVTVEGDGNAIRTVHIIANPDKLKSVA